MWGPELSRSVLNGSVPIDRLNDAVTRIVAAWYQLGQDTGYPATSFSAWTKSDFDVMYKGANTGASIRVNSHINVQAAHATTARAVARDGIALLKNTGNVLPLSTSDVIRVFGSDAGANPSGPNGCSDRGCNQGVLGMGWGVWHIFSCFFMTWVNLRFDTVWHSRLSIPYDPNQRNPRKGFQRAVYPPRHSQFCRHIYGCNC